MGLGLRQKSRQLFNSVKRLTGVGAYWFWLKTDAIAGEIDIIPLVYPHRYDILIRKSYFDFYTVNRDLYLQNFEEYLELAMGHQYFDWFRHVLMVRFEPQSVGDEVKTKALFAHRVRAAAALHDSIQANGFNPEYPIVPFTGENIGPMDSGRDVTSGYFMGDGCHRLACLMSMGYKSLPRDFVRVKCFSNLVPIDNTALLESHLDIIWPDDFTIGVQ